MDKMDLSQIVIEFVVIEHGLINHGIAHVCDNTMLMISTLAISTIRVTHYGETPTIVIAIKNT